MDLFCAFKITPILTQGLLIHKFILDSQIITIWSLAHFVRCHEKSTVFSNHLISTATTETRWKVTVLCTFPYTTACLAVVKPESLFSRSKHYLNPENSKFKITLKISFFAIHYGETGFF